MPVHVYTYSYTYTHTNTHAHHTPTQTRAQTHLHTPHIPVSTVTRSSTLARCSQTQFRRSKPFRCVDLNRNPVHKREITISTRSCRTHRPRDLAGPITNAHGARTRPDHAITCYDLMCVVRCQQHVIRARLATQSRHVGGALQLKCMFELGVCG